MLQHLMDVMRNVASEAGMAIMAVRADGFVTGWKADASPVTKADKAAEAIILSRLAEAFPDIPAMAEEACSEGMEGCATKTGFFLIDPLDGTREFVAGRNEFTVNIALVQAGRPVAGVVFAPALNEMYAGSALGAFRWCTPYGDAEPISARDYVPEAAVALASRSHRTGQTDLFLERLQPAQIVSMGSSLKFCRIAEGVADIYPCFGTTMEWDTAAGEAVLEAAGGTVRTPDGLTLTYGKHERLGRGGFANPEFIATGRTAG
nr:3'(2'),5'-bisphosphate nucleotidase CysQ [Aureimonas fodinaquatilis]